MDDVTGFYENDDRLHATTTLEGIVSTRGGGGGDRGRLESLYWAKTPVEKKFATASCWRPESSSTSLVHIFFFICRGYAKFASPWLALVLVLHLLAAWQEPKGGTRYPCKIRLLRGHARAHTQNFAGELYSYSNYKRGHSSLHAQAPSGSSTRIQVDIFINTNIFIFFIIFTFIQN